MGELVFTGKAGVLVAVFGLFIGVGRMDLKRSAMKVFQPRI